MEKSFIYLQERLGLEGDILTDSLHPLPRSRRRSKPSDEAEEAVPTRAKSQRRSKPWSGLEEGEEGDCADLNLLPGPGEVAEAVTDPLLELECDLIVKEEMDISIKFEPAD